MIEIITFFFPNVIYRLIEIGILITFFSLNILLKWHILNKKRVTQKIIFYLTNFLITLCIAEIFFGLILDFFPIMNLLIRSFLIILLNKKLREEWKKIFHIIYQTKTVSFIVFFNLFLFSLIGHMLFQKENNDFSTYLSSLNSMFILITTCNFPDVMFEVLNISHFAVYFFVSYLIVNFFLFLSLLKVLIYTNYLEINKNMTLEIMKKISQFEIRLTEDDLNHIALFKQKYNLTDSEFQKFKELLNLSDSSNLDESLCSTNTLHSQYNEDEEKKKQYRLLRFLRMKRTEIIVNIVNLIVIGIAIINTKNIVDYIIQDIVFIYFLLEYIVYIRYYGFQKLVRRKILRTLFFVISISGIVVMTYLILHNIIEDEENFESIVKVGRTFVMLRSTRIFLLLNAFEEYKIIFTTLNHMKRIFRKLLAIQFSFFFIFSSVSMIFLGGKIKNDQYVNSKTIPEYYSYINFNSFGSSFITCFSFMVINNTNIQTEALSQVAGDWFKGYFTIFYFLGTVVMLNVFQTIVLEMYVIIKKSKKI
jgi:hypothetical protein